MSSLTEQNNFIGTVVTCGFIVLGIMILTNNNNKESHNEEDDYNKIRELDNVDLRPHSKYLSQFYPKSKKELLKSRSDKYNYIFIYTSPRQEYSTGLGDDLNNRLNVIQERCIDSVITLCSDKYNIILVDRYNIGSLIDEKDKNDICNISPDDVYISGNNVTINQWDAYCKAKLLYTYGGTVITPDFMLIKCPKQSDIFYNKFTIGMHVNEGNNISNRIYVPESKYFISSPKGDKTLKLYCQYLSNVYQTNYSEALQKADLDFQDMDLLPYFNMYKFGIKKTDGNPFYVEDIFVNYNNVGFSNENFCVYINNDLINISTNYSWLKQTDFFDIAENTFIRQYSYANHIN